MFHAGPANSRRFRGAICSTQGPPDRTEFRVPYDPRRARQTQQNFGCHMIHAGPANSRRNAGAICCPQSPPNPTDFGGPMMHAGPARFQKNKGAYGARRTRQTQQISGYSMLHAGPAKSPKNQGALCCDLNFGSKNAKMKARPAKPQHNAFNKTPQLYSRPPTTAVCSS